jgi:hypothetical protein
MQRTFMGKWQDSPQLRRTGDANSFAFLGILLATLLLTAGPALGEALDCTADNARLYLDLGATVPLDNTGVGSWNFLNPRRPFALVRPKRFPQGDPRLDTAKTFQEKCFATLLVLAAEEDPPLVELSFVNQTVDRSFDVTIPFEIRLPRLTSLQEARTDLLLRALADNLNRVPEVQRAINAEMRQLSLPPDVRPDLGQAVYADPQNPTLGEAKKFLRKLDSLRTYLKTQTAQEEELQGKLQEAQAEADSLKAWDTELNRLQNAPPTADVQQALPYVRRKLEEARGAQALVEQLQGKVAAAEQLAPLQQAVDEAETLDRSLDVLVETGNPMMAAGSPPSPEETITPITEAILAFHTVCRKAVQRVNADLGGKVQADLSGTRTELGACADSITALSEQLSQTGIDLTALSDFRNEVVGLQGLFAIFNPPQDASAAEKQEAREKLPLKLSELCQGKDGLLSCSYRLSIPPGGPPARVPSGLPPALPKGLVEFKVSFRDEGITPTNTTGYLATVPKPNEQPNRLTWALTGSVGYAASPSFADRQESYTTDTPFNGSRTSEFKGAGTLDLDTFLGNRARGQVAVTFKQGSLGNSELGAAGADARQTEVGKYIIDIFSETGLGMRLGKYEMAIPASKITFTESGEGFEFFYRWLSLGYIVKRESVGFKADDDDLDSDIVIAQIKNFSTGRIRPIRNFSLIAAWGEDEKAENAGEFWSAGTELHFSEPTAHLAGSFAYFHSQTQPKGQDSKRRKGKGDTGLLTVGRSWLNAKNEQLSVLSFNLASEPGTIRLRRTLMRATSARAAPSQVEAFS